MLSGWRMNIMAEVESKEGGWVSVGGQRNVDIYTVNLYLVIFFCQELPTHRQTILENSFIKHVLQLAVNEMYALNC